MASPPLAVICTTAVSCPAYSKSTGYFSSLTRVVEVELVNYFITGNIALTKVDKDYPENKLTGAVFEVYSDTNGNGKLDKKDELLGEIGEVEKGVYQMDDLRYGKYLVREKTAPTGFVTDTVYSPIRSPSTVISPFLSVVNVWS